MPKEKPPIIKKLDQELAEAIKSARDFDRLLKVLLQAKDSSRRKMHPEYIGYPLEYAVSLFYPVSDYEDSLKAFAKVLEQDPNSPEAHHYVGHIFIHNKLYYQAHLLFDRGLRLKVPEVEDKSNDDNLHVKSHYDLCDLVHLAKQDDPTVPLSAYGFPVETLPWRNINGRFSLPNFNFNPLHPDIITSKEKCLSAIHGKLAKLRFIGNLPHTSENCPYNDYVNTSN
jgi:tetratricopeptide (TPR) repeat protein